MKVSMFDGHYKIFGSWIRIKFEPLYSDIAFIAALTEFLVVVTMLWAIVNLRVCGDKATKSVMRNSISPRQFTIEVGNMPKGVTNQELIHSMWDRLEHNIDATIVDVQLGTSNA